MKARELTDEQLRKIVSFNPAWVADNRTEWMADNQPMWMMLHRLEWVVHNRPHVVIADATDWMATQYPAVLAVYDIYALFERRPDWVFAYHPEWVAYNRPDWAAEHKRSYMQQHRAAWLAENDPVLEDDDEVPADILAGGLVAEAETEKGPISPYRREQDLTYSDMIVAQNSDEYMDVDCYAGYRGARAQDYKGEWSSRVSLEKDLRRTVRCGNVCYAADETASYQEVAVEQVPEEIMDALYDQMSFAERLLLRPELLRVKKKTLEG
jgi:hypothetical protein